MPAATVAKPRPVKMPSGERMALIARAAAKLFAEKGFHATTLKAVASSAEVSEALLLKYFPTKEDLMHAALTSCRETSFFASIQRLLPAQPSTEALVHSVRVMTEQITMPSRGPDRETRDMVNRMLLRSLCEEGDFATVMFNDLNTNLVKFLTRCLDEAARAGDMDPQAPGPHSLVAWFRIHLSLSVQSFQLPEKPPVSYAASRKQLVDALVRFQLLGMGLKSSVVAKYLQNAG
jgi:AcrR family transcriptional regulator